MRRLSEAREPCQYCHQSYLKRSDGFDSKETWKQEKRRARKEKHCEINKTVWSTIIDNRFSRQATSLVFSKASREGGSERHDVVFVWLVGMLLLSLIISLIVRCFSNVLWRTAGIFESRKRRKIIIDRLIIIVIWSPMTAHLTGSACALQFEGLKLFGRYESLFRMVRG